MKVVEASLLLTSGIKISSIVFIKDWMKSMSHFIQKTKKMKQPSLSGMTVMRINRLTKIRMAENGCFLTFLIVLRDFMSL